MHKALVVIGARYELSAVFGAIRIGYPLDGVNACLVRDDRPDYLSFLKFTILLNHIYI